jgi:Uma2 family endonuclease
MLRLVSTARRVHCTVEDYLAVEAQSALKHEFYDGEIFAMAGGKPEHAWLAGEVIAGLRGQLPVACRVGSSDLRLSIESTGLLTYPDVFVVCGTPSLDRRDPHAVTNPVLLVEVTSPSSEDYDRGEKLSHYKQIASLSCVLLVSHRARRVTAIERSDSGWRMSEARGGEVLEVKTPALRIDVDSLYAGTAL